MVPTAFKIEDMLPAMFTAPGLSETQFLALCGEFPDCTLEYTADGNVIVMPPTDPENSAGVAEVLYQLMHWSRQNPGGRVIGPDGGFRFPDGSRFSPDAAWFDDARWRAAQTPGTRYPIFAPEFLIEVRSPAQRPRPLGEKMREYIDNGVQLAWLIDPMQRTVTIYRPGREPEVLSNPATVSGDGPVQGFVLSLQGVF